MHLSVKAMAITSAVVWGGAVLGVAIANTFRPRYGREFLRVCSSIYPGYNRTGGKSVAVAAGYAAVDGAVTGALIALLYNAVTPHERAAGLPGSPDMREIA